MMSERARALEQALNRAIDRTIIAHGDEVFIGEGYSGRESLLTYFAQEVAAVEPPPSGASPQAETSEDMGDGWYVTVGRWGESLVTIEQRCLSGNADLTDDDAALIRGAAKHLQAFIGQPAPVSPVEPEPPEELPCYCDIPSHILDLGCPRHQAPQCEPEPPKTWSLERAQKLNEIADRVVVLLFVNGFGEHADRLVMKKSKQEHGDLGGWSRDAVKTVILEVLRQEVR
jgi:hypothetical protein